MYRILGLPALLVALSLLLAISVSSTRAAGTADRVWEAISRKNPKLSASTEARNFVVRYVELLEPTLGPLDNFVAVVDGQIDYACNLLCQKHFVPGFRVEYEIGVSDLVRYVFTSTCFGVIHDDDHIAKALSQLDKLTKEFKNEFFEKLPRQDQKSLRELIGDTIKSWENIARMDSSRFSRLHEVWQLTLVGIDASDARTNVLRTMSEKTNEAAKEVCRSSLVPIRVRPSKPAPMAPPALPASTPLPH